MPDTVLGLYMEQQAKAPARMELILWESKQPIARPNKMGVYVFVLSVCVGLYCHLGTPGDEQVGFIICRKDTDHTPWYKGVRRTCIGFRHWVGGLGKGPRKWGFALDWVLEKAGMSML